jgi:hypothetical protein
VHGRDAGKAVLIIIVLAGQKLEQKYDFIEDSVRPGRKTGVKMTGRSGLKW